MLSGKQTQAINLLIKGYKQKDIAEELKISENTLTNWKKDKEFILVYEKEINNIMKEVNDEFKKLSLKAVRKLGEFLDCDNEELKYTAINNILDRTGFKAVDKMEVNNNITTNPMAGLTEEELRKLIQNG